MHTDTARAVAFLLLKFLSFLGNGILNKNVSSLAQALACI